MLSRGPLCCGYVNSKPQLEKLNLGSQDPLALAGGFRGCGGNPNSSQQSLARSGARLVQPPRLSPVGPALGPAPSNSRPHWWRSAARPLLFFEYIRRWRWQLLLEASWSGSWSPRPSTLPHPPRFPLLPRSSPAALPPSLPPSTPGRLPTWPRPAVPASP